MGQPKALLETTGGIPLAVFQASLLQSAGCRKPIVVLGAEADRIAPALVRAGIEFAVNPDWPLGRFGSLQTGLRARPGFGGYLVLPVDTVGVRRETLSSLLALATEQNPQVLRPRYNVAAGRVLWLREDLAKKLLAEPIADVQLDKRLAPLASYFDVDDPAVLNNTNTPDEWAAARSTLQIP